MCRALRSNDAGASERNAVDVTNRYNVRTRVHESAAVHACSLLTPSVVE